MAAGRLALLELQMGIACYRELPAEACHSRFRAAKSADEDRGSLRCAARRSFTLLCCAGSPQFPFPPLWSETAILENGVSQVGDH